MHHLETVQLDSTVEQEKNSQLHQANVVFQDLNAQQEASRCLNVKKGHTRMNMNSQPARHVELDTIVEIKTIKKYNVRKDTTVLVEINRHHVYQEHTIQTKDLPTQMLVFLVRQGLLVKTTAQPRVIFLVTLATSALEEPSPKIQQIPLKVVECVILDTIVPKAQLVNKIAQWEVIVQDICWEHQLQNARQVTIALEKQPSLIQKDHSEMCVQQVTIAH
jgi:hypothetical protein